MQQINVCCRRVIPSIRYADRTRIKTIFQRFLGNYNLDMIVPRFVLVHCSVHSPGPFHPFHVALGRTLIVSDFQSLGQNVWKSVQPFYDSIQCNWGINYVFFVHCIFFSWHVTFVCTKDSPIFFLLRNGVLRFTFTILGHVFRELQLSQSDSSTSSTLKLVLQASQAFLHSDSERGRFIPLSVLGNLSFLLPLFRLTSFNIYTFLPEFYEFSIWSSTVYLLKGKHPKTWLKMAKVGING